MADYPHGENTLVYQAESFTTGLTVTARMFFPDMTEVPESPISLTEAGYGLYYLTYTFGQYGTYHAVFFEGGTAKVSHTFRVPRDRLLQGKESDRMVIAEP